jgi:hypothetical protein
VDYFTPQLYWPIKQEKQSYPKLLAWWAGENTKKRYLWPGNIPSRVTRKDKGWAASEIADQVEATRAQPGATGNIHFSMKPLMNNAGGVSDVLAKVYAEPALVPASRWLDDEAPPKPKGRWTPGLKELQLLPGIGEPTWLFAVRLRFGDKWETRVYPAAGRKEVRVAYAEAPERIVVTAVDRAGNESPTELIGK